MPQSDQDHSTPCLGVYFIAKYGHLLQGQLTCVYLSIKMQKRAGDVAQWIRVLWGKHQDVFDLWHSCSEKSLATYALDPSTEEVGNIGSQGLAEGREMRTADILLWSPHVCLAGARFCVHTWIHQTHTHTHSNQTCKRANVLCITMNVESVLNAGHSSTITMRQTTMFWMRKIETLTGYRRYHKAPKQEEHQSEESGFADPQGLHHANRLIVSALPCVFSQTLLSYFP